MEMTIHGRQVSVSEKMCMFEIDDDDDDDGHDDDDDNGLVTACFN